MFVPAIGWRTAVAYADFVDHQFLSVEHHSIYVSPTDPLQFVSLSLGAAHPTRKMVAFVHSGEEDGGNISDILSCTIAGISATRVLDVANTPTVNIWVADVPTGTTGSVSCDLSANPGIESWLINMFALYNANGTPYATSNSTSNSQNLALTIDVPAGGVILGSRSITYSVGVSSKSFTWVGLTENDDTFHDQSGEVCGHVSSTAAHLEFGSAQTSYTVNCNASAASSIRGGECTFAVASFKAR